MMALQDDTLQGLAAEIVRLRDQLTAAEQERLDLEILLDTTTEHSTEIEAELEAINDQLEEANTRLRLYFEQVERVTQAAGAVESGAYVVESLNEVALRQDGLGQLARVFQRMVAQVYAREQQLKRQVEELRIEIDQSKQQKQVEEITETDYFRDLSKKVNTLRNRRA